MDVLTLTIVQRNSALGVAVGTPLHLGILHGNSQNNKKIPLFHFYGII
jgi:hypothetical protein